MPVLGNHPHAAQMVTQKVLHPGAHSAAVPLDDMQTINERSIDWQHTDY